MTRLKPNWAGLVEFAPPILFRKSKDALLADAVGYALFGALSRYSHPVHPILLAVIVSANSCGLMRLFSQSHAIRIAASLTQTIAIVMFATVVSGHFIDSDTMLRHSDSV